MRAAHQRGEHLAGLVAIIVNRLLAEDDKAGGLFIGNGFEDLGDGKRLNSIIGHNQNCAVCAHGKRGAQGFLRLLRANCYGDHLGRHALFAQAERLFDGDFVERVHAHLDVGKIDAAAIGFHPRFDVIVDHPFDGDDNLHACDPCTDGDGK